MKIKFRGHCCFSIKDKDIIIVTDPHDKAKGLKGDVVTISSNSPHHSHKDAVDGEPIVFNWPGEYETKGVHFRGISALSTKKDSDEKKSHVVFKVNSGGVRMCHLSAPGVKLDEDKIEEIGDIDVLFVPVGGSVNPKEMKKTIEEIEPRVIIPMHYCDENGECDMAALNAFLGEMGSPGVQAVDEYTFKKSELSDDSSKVVVLNVQ